MAVFCRNNGSKTNNARDINVSEAGKTRDGIPIQAVTYLNSSGNVEGYLSLRTPQGERLVKWTGYTIVRGAKKPWESTGIYDERYVQGKYTSQLDLA
ncbi:MAG: hypothetical protein QG639_685 [Patescibacteria group bacterium]|nr:hypothetical protein [Patescibacteria group bacterium]